MEQSTRPRKEIWTRPKATEFHQQPEKKKINDLSNYITFPPALTEQEKKYTEWRSLNIKWSPTTVSFIFSHSCNVISHFNSLKLSVLDRMMMTLGIRMRSWVCWCIQNLLLFSTIWFKCSRRSLDYDRAEQRSPVHYGPSQQIDTNW